MEAVIGEPVSPGVMRTGGGDLGVDGVDQTAASGVEPEITLIGCDGARSAQANRPYMNAA